eukprot:6468237-Amphidinium_carterae.2
MDAANLLHVTPFRWLFSQVERADGFCLFRRAQPEKEVHGGAATTKRGVCVFTTCCTSYRVRASRTSIPQHKSTFCIALKFRRMAIDVQPAIPPNNSKSCTLLVCECADRAERTDVLLRLLRWWGAGCHSANCDELAMVR